VIPQRRIARTKNVLATHSIFYTPKVIYYVTLPKTKDPPHKSFHKPRRGIIKTVSELRSIPIRLWVRRIHAIDFGDVDGCPGFGGVVGRGVSLSKSIVSLTVKVARHDGIEVRCEVWSGGGCGQGFDGR